MPATKLLPLNEKKFTIRVILFLIYCMTNGNILAMTGKDLKEWRREYGLTQAALAKHLNVAWATVARWEINVRKIPPYLHLALATIAREIETKGGEKRDAMRKKKTGKVDD